MPRTLTAMLLGFVSAWCLLAVAFCVGLLISSAPEDPLGLLVVCATLISVACMWAAFRQRRLRIAWLFAVAPLALTLGFVTMLPVRPL